MGVWRDTKGGREGERERERERERWASGETLREGGREKERERDGRLERHVHSRIDIGEGWDKDKHLGMEGERDRGV